MQEVPTGGALNVDLGNRPAATPGRWPWRRMRPRRYNLGALWFIGPAMLLLVALVVFPLVFSLIHSLQTWDLELAPNPLRFVGLGNYAQVLTQPLFWSALEYTLGFVVTVVAIELVLGTVIALLLDQRLPGVHLARTLIILPTAVAPVVAGFMFRYMLYAGTGVLPYVLALVGIHTPAAGVLGSGRWASAGIEMTDIWQWTPFMALVILAGIQAVPADLAEAARVDGANPVRVFWFIVVPNLRFVLSVAIIIRLMQSFNVFDAIYAETMGGPGTATTSLSYLLFQNGLLYYNLGVAFAMAWLIIAIAGVLVNIYLSTAFRGVEI